MWKQGVAASIGVAAGVGCVGWGTKKAISTGNILPFCPNKEEFDQSTFRGRYCFLFCLFCLNFFLFFFPIQIF